MKSGLQIIHALKIPKSSIKKRYEKNGVDLSKYKSANEAVFLIIKDKDGKKSFMLAKDPQLKFYITKPEYWDEKGKFVNYIEKEKVKEIKCTNSKKYPTIGKELRKMGDASWENRLNDAYDKYGFVSYESYSKSGIREELNELNMDYRLHGSDMDVADYYIKEFLKNYPQNDPKYQNFFGLTKSFFDIEVDSSNIIGFPNPEEAEAPINVITWIDDKNLNCYSFCLKYEHDNYKEVMNNLDDFKARLKEKFKDVEKKLGKEITYHIIEYDDELELIADFFNVINKYKPDFCSAWNISFDFVTIYNRIKKLGADPADIICPDEIEDPYKYVNINLDTRNSDPADKGDYYSVTGYTCYYDLLNLYANLTKPYGKKDNYTLDYIGEIETGMRKDSLEGTNIKTAHLDNYAQFLEYNINDTIMLLMIEEKTRHLSALYSLSIMTNTRLEKTLKKTVSIRNYAALFYEENGYVISNNHSKNFPKLTEKIKGALNMSVLKIF